jgi:multicomponent Na+:H+ antiporter subunit B
MKQPQESIVERTVARLLIPFIQLFGLYVIMHGHTSPGGGFQGGVILGSSIILFAIAYGFRRIEERISDDALTTYTGSGVLIYGGTGLVCLLLGANFLDYSALPIDFEPRGMGMLAVEIGVGITVMAVMVSLFRDLISFGEEE